MLREAVELVAEVLHLHHRGEDAGIRPWLRQRCTPDDLAALAPIQALMRRTERLLRVVLGAAYRFARRERAAVAWG